MASIKNALTEKAQEVTTGAGAGKEKRQPKTIKDLIVVMKPEIEKALPSVITPERFTRMVFTALSSNPKLEACDPKTFLGAMMQSAQLGLEPNTPLGQAYLIPYGKQCQFQIGYKGMIDLAYRSGEFTQIYAQVVYENDAFDYELGLEPKITHKPVLKNRGEAVLYYAVFRLKNGGYGFEVMSKEDIENFAKKKSKTYHNGPWQTDFDEMAKKTVLKKVLKYAPIKTDYARQITADETVKTNITEDMTELQDETETIDITPSETAIDANTDEVLEVK